MGDLYLSQYAAHGCPDISGSAYRVLMRMAVVVRDEDTAPDKHDEGLYYGGWKGLTAVLGYGVWPDNEELSPAAKRTISRAIRELRDHHYLDVADKQNQGAHWNRTYRLSLTAWPLKWQTRGQSV